MAPCAVVVGDSVAEPIRSRGAINADPKAEVQPGPVRRTSRIEAKIIRSMAA
jgi:hypothetical protein